MKHFTSIRQGATASQVLKHNTMCYFLFETKSCWNYTTVWNVILHKGFESNFIYEALIHNSSVLTGKKG